MRRTGFKKKNYNDIMNVLKKARKTLKNSHKKRVKRVSKKTYYKELLAQNKWINKIPMGSHGSTPLQKRWWKLTTDFRRIEDFLRWGTCPSCNKPFTTWEESQGGHYRAYSLCKGYKKFCDKNVFAQCAYCNSRMNEDKFEGGRIFADNIVKRYGQERLDLINTYTKGSPEKLEVPIIIEKMQEILNKMAFLAIKPDYYDKLS